MDLVLLSGGVDSSTALALARKKTDDVAAVTFNYGQRHAKMELEAARKIADYYGVDLLEYNLEEVFKLGKSSLNDLSLKVTEGDYGAQENANTEVEFRNGVFISILTSIAMQVGASSIYYGCHRDDFGPVYPDASHEFFFIFKKLIKVGTSGRVQLEAPFISMTKKDIVATGIELGVPYELTYSCYNGTNPPCGVCGTCINRRKAFEANGLALI